MSSATSSLATLSAAEMGREIEAKRLDPVEIAETACARAEAAADTFALVTRDRAIGEAKAAARRAALGVRRGPLDGVPISWKDLFDLAGEPTCAGSTVYRLSPTVDAALVSRCAAAGLVTIGKTHLTEFAFSGLGVNPKTATAPNRYDPMRAPGGSSSGAAASVAASIVPLAIGTDTGGSVRIPAAWNGLVGLKTTHGALPMDGVTALSPSLDTAGPLAHRVDDVALAWSALSERAPPDLHGAAVDGMRFLALTGGVAAGLDSSIEEAHAAALVRLETAGARIDRDAVPLFDAALERISDDGAIVNAEALAVWRRLLEMSGDAVFKEVRARFFAAESYSAEQLACVRMEMARLSRVLVERLAGYDGLVLPTTLNTPPYVETLLGDSQAYARENARALGLTHFANSFRLTALTLPAGPDPIGPGLPPASLMVFGPPNTEARLLRVGAAIERAFGGPT